MKKGILLLLALLPLIGRADCVVEDQWLNMDYDHSIDYQNKNIPTDFFVLVYSNSPSFCQYMESKGRTGQVSFQCESPNTFGWVIHGLWGESKAAYISGDYKKHPRFCQGDLPKVSLDEIKPYLCMSPGTRLLQGEWEKHGACDFDTATAYFEQAKTLYESYKLPPADLNARAAMNWMRANNPELKDKWLHQSGREFGICFDKNFELMSCPKK